MKNLASVFAFVGLLVASVSAAETSFDSDRLWDVKFPAGHSIGESLSPKQTFTGKSVQAPVQAPFQTPSKMELQAPSKFSAEPRATKVCTLIPGRSARVARRADRAAAAEARLQGRTLLEISQGNTVMENGACTTCSTGRTMLENPSSLTNLTTRELLEGGQITRQVRTINEPGVCGGNGNGGGGGRFRIFRR